ncbi:hypothetical protein [Pseudonocardia parietis]|uniref:hypothetical protein n=1 Tax=Pseudonocardia parietis TaxID=570936 RepID=UPI001AE2FC61
MIPRTRAAFSFNTRGRTSSLISSAAKSSIHRSGAVAVLLDVGVHVDRDEPVEVERHDVPFCRSASAV